MAELSNTKVLAAKVEFFDQKFRTPMRLSSGVIDTITEARATVRVAVGNQEATGIGSIYLSDLWAWPDHNLSHEKRDAVLRELCVEAANNLSERCGDAAHPLELGLRLRGCFLSKMARPRFGSVGTVGRATKGCIKTQE